MKTAHFCVLIHCSADCWLCLKQFAPGICPSQKIGLKTIKKISITKNLHDNRFLSKKKIPGRKPDSEAGCIFENFTPKQGNLLKILAAGNRNHGVSLPLPLRHYLDNTSTKTWQTSCQNKFILSIKIKQQDLLSDSKNVFDLIAYLRLLRITECSVHYNYRVRQLHQYLQDRKEI